MSSANSAGHDHDHGAVRLEPQHRRGRAGYSGGHLAQPAGGCRRTCRGRRPIQKVNPAEQPIFYLALSIDHAAALHSRRVRRNTAGAAHLDGAAACRGCRCSATQKYAVRVQVDPDAAGGARHRHRRCAEGDRPGQHQPAHGQAGRREPGVHGGIERAADKRGRLPAADRGVPQRRAGAARTGGQRDRRRRERQGRSRWYQRRPRHDAGHPASSRAPTPWRWSTTSGGCCRSSARDSARRASGDRVRRSEPIRDSIDDVKFTLVLTVCLVVMVIFLFLRNLSATLIPGVAVPLSIIGTFARDVPAGLQPQQSFADGADAVGGLRGGRRDRDAGEHRAPHGNGRVAHGGGARWLRARSASRSSR